MRKIALTMLLMVSISVMPASAQPGPPLSKIIFGSCIKQDKPTPIFKAIIAQRPELLLFLGDNIYADTTDMAVMRTKYRKLKSNPDFARLIKLCPTMATWDDHDYGANDAGAKYQKRKESQKAFLDFWGEPAESLRRKRAGVYHAKIFGPIGKRVQIIMLDTRYFRGPLKRGKRRVGGPYVPSPDRTSTMLGSAQWKWLEAQLRKAAEVRIMVSSIQCVSEAAGQETWSNLPHERARLFNMITKTKANGIVILSGDRHWAELSVENKAAPYPIYDLTSSSFNQKHARGTPTKNNNRAIAKTFHQENYGIVAIDWKQANPQITVQVVDLRGKPQIEKTIRFSELQPKEK